MDSIKPKTPITNKEEAIEYALSFIKECNEKGINISEAWIFGSTAKGWIDEETDIDLALISDNFTSNFSDNIKLTANLNYKYAEIMVRYFNKEQFESDEPSINRIKNKGIKIY